MNTSDAKNIECRNRDDWFWISGEIETSDVRHQTSDIRHQMSDIRRQTSDVRHQTIRYQISDILLDFCVRRESAAGDVLSLVNLIEMMTVNRA